MRKTTDNFANGNFDSINSNVVTMPTGDPGRFVSRRCSASDDNYSNCANDEYDEIFGQLLTAFDAGKRCERIIQLQTWRTAPPTSTRSPPT